MDEELQRLPSEMQARPKIPRTPEGGQRPAQRQQDIPQQQQPLIPKIKGQEVIDQQQIDEFKQAFAAKGDKIPRTPPEDQMRDYQNQQINDEPFYRDSPQHHARGRGGAGPFGYDQYDAFAEPGPQMGNPKPGKSLPPVSQDQAFQKQGRRIIMEQPNKY
jgi:hypothetical protein